MFAQTLPPRDIPVSIRLLHPLSGMTFRPDGVHFEAIAVDPDGGPLTRVEFLAGDEVVAVSDRSGDVFPTVIGLAVPHKAAWPKAAVGVHVIRARAVVQRAVVAQSEPVRIVVTEGVEPPPPPPPVPTNGPVVALMATRPTTSEPSPLIRIAPGLFTVTRRGDLSEPLKVRYAIGGTAANGVDYQFLDGDLMLGAGEATGEILVMPIDDEEVEPTETVLLRLLPDAAYQVSAASSAMVTIFNINDRQAATLRIVSPRSGTVFTVPARIRVELDAVDPAGYIPQVEFLTNGVSAGVSRIDFIQAPEAGTVLRHGIDWEENHFGGYEVTAVAVDSQGRPVKATPIRLLVRGTVEPPKIVRHPADVRPEDGVLSGDEVAAYATAWRSGGKFGNDLVPMRYLTRAGFLSEAGDGYRFDATRGPLPLAWVSTNPQAEPRPGIDFLPPFGAGGVIDFGTNVIPPRLPLSYVVAEFPRFTEPGEYTVQVRTGPVAKTRSHAVELYLGGDVEFSAASDDGVFDSSNRVVRWGPFADDTARRMSVTLKAAGEFKMRAAGSFDGRDGISATIPQAPVVPGAVGSVPRIATLESMDNGGVQLVVLGGAAGGEMDVEVSTDLVRWVRIARGTAAAEVGAMVTVDGDAGDTPVRFYRAVPRTP
jgi:Calx-beta domain